MHTYVFRDRNINSNSIAFCKQIVVNLSLHTYTGDECILHIVKGNTLKKGKPIIMVINPVTSLLLQHDTLYFSEKVFFPAEVC